MKFFFAAALVCLSLQNVIAQKSPIKFGVIPMEDMTMKVYPADTTAPAVILTDFGRAEMSILTTSVRMNFERHIRIKILKNDGLEWANAKIRLDHDGTGSAEERVTNLKASTFNLVDGKIVETKMSKDAVFKEKFNKYTTHQKFTLPDVKVGSVIEYSYTVSSQYFTSLPNWQFQHSIPTRWSEFWAIFPQEFVYEKYMQGYIATTSKNPKQNWCAENVPAFKPEPYMTSEEDYIARINFALSYVNFPGRQIEIMGSWDKYNKDLTESDSFFGAIKGSGFLKKHVEEITAGKTEPEERIAAIYDWVRNNIEWDGIKDTYPDNLKKIMEAKKGTSSDINVLLASMINKAGYDVDMVMLSTRDHGFIRKLYPMARQFNYNVCRVRLDQREILLDATDKYIPFGILPERCLNGEGFAISKTHSGWIKLNPTIKSRTVTSSDLILDADGLLKGKLAFRREGYAAVSTRHDYHKNGKDEYQKSVLSGKTWEVVGTDFKIDEELNKPVEESYDLVLNDIASSTGSQIYFNPIVAGQIVENPFKSEVREYPVDFTCPSERVYSAKIVIPEGYAIEELPQTKIFALPGNAGRFIYNVGFAGNTVNVTAILTINKALFVQDEYPQLREFFNLIVAKQSEQIVLKKI